VRFPRTKLWWLMIGVAVVAVLLGGLVRWWQRSRLMEFKRQCVFTDLADLTKDFGDFTKVPLDQSPYLRDVAEPIKLIRTGGFAGSDDHWIGVSFVDQKNVERHARYAFYVWAGRDISDQLMLDNKGISPHGPEEHAYLGLLQRWYLRDAEAREFHDHLKPSDLPKLTEEQKAKVMGVSILRKLLMRK
jgi:hypothetical protein